MAFDAFLNIATIPGESTDDAHKDWIEILSYDHAVRQPTSGSVSSGGSRTAERVDHGNFNVVKAIDKATPKLYLSCCKGEHINEVKLEVCRSGGDKMKYYEVILTDVTVASVSCSGQSKGATASPIPVENVSFAYGTIKWTYTQTDHKTGQKGGDVAGSWDLHANTGA
jgi:type VI secretion system secreted protein Hcp